MRKYARVFKYINAYKGGVALYILFIILSIIFSIVSIAMFITYWVKVNDVRKELITLKEVHESREDGSIL